MLHTTPHAPPPWKLTGSGFILLYRFDETFVAENGFVVEPLLPQYRGGLGAVMLVDYRTSPVGPYQELLFIPGRFQYGRRRYYHISKIYVSTQASVENGQENWGIPKELADFKVEQLDVRRRRFAVAAHGTPILEAEVESGLLRFPFNTFFNPFPARLLQARDRDGAVLTFEPNAGGTVSLAASLVSLAVDGAHFPDVAAHKPLGVVEAVNFRMTFPIPKAEE